MTDLLIVEPIDPLTIAASRGTMAANLVSRSPKDVWADAAGDGGAQITVDLGTVRSIDTILLGYVHPPAAGARWSITGGVGGAGEFAIQPDDALRVPDIVGDVADRTHALWHGPAVEARHLTITLFQPAGAPLLTAGVLAIGRSWSPALGRDWGFGRRPIDTGTTTALADGGFAVVEGVRKRALSWTFADLTPAEADRLESIALRRGRTVPAVVIEDATRSAGLAARIHYGLFGEWRAFDRRNRRQTRWELTFEEWI